MDGVLVDFNGYAQAKGLTGEEVKAFPGAYLSMQPIPGAISAVKTLIELGFDVWVATKPPTGIAFAYADKAQWIYNYLPELSRKIIMTPDKGLLGDKDDILIDDRPWRANCDAFPGTLVTFGGAVNWASVMQAFEETA